MDIYCYITLAVLYTISIMQLYYYISNKENNC